MCVPGFSAPVEVKKKINGNMKVPYICLLFYSSPHPCSLSGATCNWGGNSGRRYRGKLFPALVSGSCVELQTHVSQLHISNLYPSSVPKSCLPERSKHSPTQKLLRVSGLLKQCGATAVSRVRDEGKRGRCFWELRKKEKLTVLYNRHFVTDIS